MKSQNETHTTYEINVGDKTPSGGTGDTIVITLCTDGTIDIIAPDNFMSGRLRSGKIMLSNSTIPGNNKGMWEE